jgi:HemK-related putative methylase
MKTIKYQPFPNIKNFYIQISTSGEPLWVKYQNKKYSFQLKIRKGGYIPKLGLILCQAISKIVNNKKVLDLGTGETGLMAIFSAKYGATRVIGSDIDSYAVKWAKCNACLNNVTNSKWINSDLFKKIDGKFNLIISNPPQMPMLRGSLHDSGGKDGRRLINKIIKLTPKYLLPGGELIMVIFDFLGIDKDYGSGISIFQLLRKAGFKPSIIAKSKRLISPIGNTTKAISLIKKIYPKYTFTKNGQDELYHEVCVVRGVLIS